MKYKIMNDFDGNDTHELEATDRIDALQEALGVLGWSLVEEQDDEPTAGNISDAIDAIRGMTHDAAIGRLTGARFQFSKEEAEDIWLQAHEHE